MGPKPRDVAADVDLFRMELVNLIDQRHELVKLAALIEWSAFVEAWGARSSRARRAARRWRRG